MRIFTYVGHTEIQDDTFNLEMFYFASIAFSGILTIQRKYLGCHQQISRTCIQCDIRFENAHVYAGKKPRRFKTFLNQVKTYVSLIDNILKLFYQSKYNWSTCIFNLRFRTDVGCFVESALVLIFKFRVRVKINEMMENRKSSFADLCDKSLIVYREKNCVNALIK